MNKLWYFTFGFPYILTTYKDWSRLRQLIPSHVGHSPLPRPNLGGSHSHSHSHSHIPLLPSQPLWDCHGHEEGQRLFRRRWMIPSPRSQVPEDLKICYNPVLLVPVLHNMSQKFLTSQSAQKPRRLSLVATPGSPWSCWPRSPALVANPGSPFP